MEDSPTQSLIVRLPVDKARRIVRIVDSLGSAYETVDEFIRVAVENQLTMEESGSDRAADTPSGSASSRSDRGGSQRQLSREGAATGAPAGVANAANPQGPKDSDDFNALLRRAQIDGLRTHEATATSGLALSSFTNRLTPLLAGPRVLAKLSSSGEAPRVDRYLDLTAKVSRHFGVDLRAEDEAAERRGRHRRSTAWPIGDEESKSFIRYRNCFMFSAEKGGGYTGPLLDLGFVSISDHEVFLTGAGAAFASAMSPAIDDPDGIDLLSDDHRQILSEAIVRIPGELTEIKQFLTAVERVSGAQDEVDKDLGVHHKEWSEAQVVSHRAAMVGRLRDLLVIDVEPLPSAKSQIVPGINFARFTELANETENEGADK